jgi:hypothetical protein
MSDTVQAKIAELEAEMARTQKNKATNVRVGGGGREFVVQTPPPPLVLPLLLHTLVMIIRRIPLFSNVCACVRTHPLLALTDCHARRPAYDCVFYSLLF